MNIIDHIQKYIGPIQEGWKDRDSKLNIQIVRCNDELEENLNHFLSLGLSDSILSISPRKKVRQEFLFSVRSFDNDSLIFYFLMLVCEAVVARKKAVLRGEYIRLPAEVAMDMGFDALYCSIPMLQEDGFSSFDKVDPPVIMVWLIPIYKSEAEFVDLNGWGMFEDVLQENQSDLFSISRSKLF